MELSHEERSRKNSNIANATIVGAVSEESALYASANKEYLAILDDKTLGRTLEGISEYKVNPKYQYRNINQQVGFSAELKEQAHANARNILTENGKRVVQYGNLSVDQKAQIGERFPDYATPNKNHELVDYVMVDRNGNVISNTLTQSKFVGKDGAECFEKFLSKGYEKYLKNGVKMEIPKDFFGDFQKEVNIKIKSLESQIAKQKSFGDFQKIAKLEEKLQKCKIIKANREHGIEDAIIEEVIDIVQILSLIHRHEDRLDRSDLSREEKKAVRAELQKSIDENLEALRKIINI